VRATVPVTKDLENRQLEVNSAPYFSLVPRLNMLYMAPWTASKGESMKIRRALLALSSLAVGMVLSACKSCTAQHNPRPDQERFKMEEANANQAIETLNPDGSVPAPKAVASSGGAGGGGVGVEKYNAFCVPCHDADGTASSPAAAAMSPRPRNFTDAKWQASVDDARIAKVIKEGGASVGLSATMAPWGATLSDAEITEIVKHIRSFKK
jgi:cytochrome c553